MVYRFAECELDEGLYQLRRAGSPVALEPKVFDVLAYLVQHRDRVVSKDELLDKLWPGQVVGENALTRCIRAARSAVGDDGVKQDIIATQHGRGYRFVAPLTTTSPVVSPQLSVVSQTEAEREKPQTEIEIEAEKNEHVDSGPRTPDTGRLLRDFDTQAQSPAPPAPRLSPQRLGSRTNFVLLGLLLLISIVIAVQYLSLPTPTPQALIPSPQSLTPSSQSLPLPDKPSIAVMPFTNMSGDPEQEYFSDGLTDDLITDLSRISSLFVIARHSTFTYKGKAVKVQDVSKELGVRYVVEGSVRKTDEQIRINAQLVDATTGHQLWAQRYDRPLQDIFTLQDEIVQKIVTTLGLQFTLQEQGYVVRKTTDNLEAYDYYLRGLEHFFRMTKENNLQARQMFEKAIELDPQYAEAYSCLGSTYNLGWLWRWSQDAQTLEQALAMAQRAVALNESLPKAHGLLGMIYAQKKLYDQAIAEGERAIALDPNNADSYLSQAEALNILGRPEEALRSVEQAIRFNPRVTEWYLANLGIAYFLMGRYTDAIPTVKNLLARNPSWLSARTMLSLSYVRQWYSQLTQDPETLGLAVEAAQRAVTLNGAYGPAHLALGFGYLFQREYEQAITEMEQAIAVDSSDARSYAILAWALSWAGKSDEALQLVAEALRRKPLVVDVHLDAIGSAYYFAGKPEEAIAPLKQFLSRYPNILPAHLTLAAVYSDLGKEAEAQAEAAEVLRLNPKFSLDVHKERTPIKDPATLERHIEALRKAGLT